MAFRSWRAPLSALRWAVIFRLLLYETPGMGSIPPEFIARQQDIAIRVYCEHWRKTPGRRPLEGAEVKQVILDLEKLYPNAFPQCRSDAEPPCLTWLEALVSGLRRYGHTNLREVCTSPSVEDGLPPAGFGSQSQNSIRNEPW
jgi:hypothetical protein